MDTKSPQYLEYLNNSYHIGRSIFLSTFIYPRYLKDSAQGDIWDFGCGMGEFLSFCNKRNRSVYGIDSNPYLVRACRARELTVWLDDITNTKTLKNQVNNIICDNVLEHLSHEEIASFLSNAKTIMFPGGVLLVIVPGWNGCLREPTHKTFITIEFMRSLCETMNLTIANIYNHPF
jgi:2-polyprenyl-3-methyl-5-hydroxy-6-metoxy-1,4-benzoquinol methylase